MSAVFYIVMSFLNLLYCFSFVFVLLQVGSDFGYFPKDLLEINHNYSNEELELPTDVSLTCSGFFSSVGVLLFLTSAFSKIPKKEIWNTSDF